MVGHGGSSVAGASASAAEVICVIVHGRTQTADDMRSQIAARLSTTNVRFHLLQATGNSWYDARAIDPLTEATRAQLDAAIAHLDGVVQAARSEAAGVPLVIVGFSQGGCLAAEYVFRHDPWREGGRGALCLLTSCRIGGSLDVLPERSLYGLPVYASCGDEDPWIPLDAYFSLAATLARNGARLRSDVFPGRPHEVDAVECAALDELLAAVASRPLPTTEGHAHA